MNKWSLPIILVAFIILGVSLNVQQHTNKQNAEPTHEERVEVVGGGETKESNEEVVEDLHDGIIQSTTSSKDSEITNYIKEVWGDNATYGINLAKCESSLYPGAVSPSGKYVGLYQFDEPTFDSNCNGVRENWKDQVRCTKILIDRGEYFRWPACTEKLK